MVVITRIQFRAAGEKQFRRGDVAAEMQWTCAIATPTLNDAVNRPLTANPRPSFRPTVLMLSASLGA